MSDNNQLLDRDRLADARSTLQKRRSRLSSRHHMSIPWHDLVETPSDEESFVPASAATLKEKTTLVGRVGLMFLAVGTGAWRIRESMNTVARSLGVTCSADVGLLSLDYTCFDGSESYSECLALHTSGVNTDKLWSLEVFVREFPEKADKLTVEQIHQILDEINKKPGNYKPWNVGLASAIACCAFTFLLGGGLPEMILAFIGAGLGNWLRRRMLDKHIALIGCIIASVALACCAYVGCYQLGHLIWPTFFAEANKAGYICAMLFIIPGFPLITGGIDLAKLDMRSGLERLAYALFMITVATLTGWVTALALQFHPADFVQLQLGPVAYCLLRLVASFFGVYGFSLMFNSPRKMAALAGLIGMFSNTLRLELVDLCGMEPAAAAFIGAFASGMAASAIKGFSGFPRISLTVPSIVIMVPGLYLYRGFYNLGIMHLPGAAHWMCMAILIVLALPLGLVAARILTDRNFRHCT